MLCASRGFWVPTHRKILEITFAEYTATGDWTPGPLVRFWPCSIRLACAADYLQAFLRVERHDDVPAPQSPPWEHVGEGSIDVAIGLHLYSDLHNAWLPDVGIGLGAWNVRVWTTGRAEAAALEQELDFSTPDVPHGPERWLLQLWPDADFVRRPTAG